MTITALTSLAARDEIEIAAIRHPGDLTTVLTTVNDQRGSSSGRVWFLLAAAEEYVRTGRRPRCVDWAPEAA